MTLPNKTCLEKYWQGTLRKALPCGPSYSSVVAGYSASKGGLADCETAQVWYICVYEMTPLSPGSIKRDPEVLVARRKLRGSTSVLLRQLEAAIELSQVRMMSSLRQA